MRETQCPHFFGLPTRDESRSADPGSRRLRAPDRTAAAPASGVGGSVAVNPVPFVAWVASPAFGPGWSAQLVSRQPCAPCCDGGPGAGAVEDVVASPRVQLVTANHVSRDHRAVVQKQVRDYARELYAHMAHGGRCFLGRNRP